MSNPELEKVLTNRNFEAMLQSIKHRDEQIQELSTRLSKAEAQLAQFRAEVKTELHQIKVIAAHN